MAVDEAGKSESAHGPASLRAEEAWDALPGEEHAVDFADAGIPTDEPVDLEPPLFAGWEPIMAPGVLASTEFPPELTIDVSVTHPDGRRWNFGVAVPVDDEEGLPDDVILQALRDQLDAAHEGMRLTFFGRRAAALSRQATLDFDR